MKPLPATLAAPVQAAPVSAPPVQPPPQNLPQTTSQVLAARSQLQRSQEHPPKRVNRRRIRARPVNNAALERLSSITERVQARPAVAAVQEKAPAKRSLSLESDDNCRNGERRGRDAEGAEESAGA